MDQTGHKQFHDLWEEIEVNEIGLTLPLPGVDERTGCTGGSKDAQCYGNLGEMGTHHGGGCPMSCGCSKTKRAGFGEYMIKTCRFHEKHGRNYPRRLVQNCPEYNPSF